METVEIQIEPRETGTKGKAKRLRRDGKLPGVFYGPKAQTVPLEVDRKDFMSRVADLEGVGRDQARAGCAAPRR